MAQDAFRHPCCYSYNWNVYPNIYYVRHSMPLATARPTFFVVHYAALQSVACGSLANVSLSTIFKFDAIDVANVCKRVKDQCMMLRLPLYVEKCRAIYIRQLILPQKHQCLNNPYVFKSFKHVRFKPEVYRDWLTFLTCLECLLDELQ